MGRPLLQGPFEPKDAPKQAVPRAPAGTRAPGGDDFAAALREALAELKRREQPVTPEEQRVTAARLLKAARTLGWEHPFFCPVIAEVDFRVSRLLPTAWMTEDGHAYFNPDFVAPLPDEQLQGLIAHELSHLIMLHHLRRGDRHPVRWNLAADRALNAILWDSGIRPPHCGALPEVKIPGTIPLRTRLLPYCQDPQCSRCGVYPDADVWTHSAEQLYEDEEAPAGPLLVLLVAGAGCGVLPGEDPLPPGLTISQAEAVLLRKWQEIRAQCEQTGKQYGDAAGNALGKLLELPPARVKWKAVLRRAAAISVAQHGRDTNTWTRRNRRSGIEGPQYPGWQAKRCRVAVAVDSSGSMSDADLTEAVANICSIARASGVAFYLVVHDAKLQWEGWIAPGDKPEKIAEHAFTGRGGTRFDEAYAAIGKVRARFDSLIHLTDGEVGRWPDRPANCKKLVAALLGSKSRADVPEGAQVIDATIR